VAVVRQQHPIVARQVVRIDILKLAQLRATIQDPVVLAREEKVVTDKDCLCEGLGAGVLLKGGMTPPHKLTAVTICPGPNTAYFNQVVSLRSMVDHIYGRKDLLNGVVRPHMFIKELGLYVQHLKQELERASSDLSVKQQRRLNTFKHNLLDGIQYYAALLQNVYTEATQDADRFRRSLEEHAREVQALLLPEAQPTS